MLPAITAAFPQDLTNSGIAAMQNVLIHPTRNKQDKKIRREQGGVIDPVQSRKMGCTIRWLVHFSQAQTHMGFQFRRFRLLWRNTYRYTHSTESTATHTTAPWLSQRKGEGQSLELGCHCAARRARDARCSHTGFSEQATFGVRYSREKRGRD